MTEKSIKQLKINEKLVGKSKSKKEASINTKTGKHQQHREMSIKIASIIIRERLQYNDTATNSEINKASFNKHMETHTRDI